MANSQTTPDVLAQPFAENGDKNAIPTTNDPSTGLASLSLGLPPITSQRIQDGGKAPRRADVNGIMNLVSQQHYFFQNGGFYPFRADVSSAIGGYPLNALLLDVDSDGKVSFMQSLVGNNTYNYVTNPEYVDNIHWRKITLGASKLPLLIHIWSDHLLNDIQWLRADTFSWQSGDVYKAVYNHLVDDIDGVSSSTEVVGSYTITYYQASDGHKIVMPNQEAVVQNIYNESGVAWYYILDTVNNRFKLPRENPAREELIQVVRAKGNGLAKGMTDGTSNYGEISTQYTAQQQIYQGRSSSAYGVSVGTTGFGNGTTIASGTALGITTDSTKSGIVSDMKDSTSVYKGNRYLYFYVGSFSQSAVEQTAGITSEELDGKLDIDLGNITSPSKAAIRRLGMPDYTAGVSVTSADLNAGYEAPYDGILVCSFNSNGTCSINSLVFNTSIDGNNKPIREIHLNQGDVIKTSNLSSSYAGTNIFFPLKGV